jgi:hypothetical protein
VSGGARKAAYVLPTIITIAVIALAGTALLQQRQERSERLAEAEKIGAAYFSDVATFEAEVQSDLAKVRSGDPEDLKKVLERGPIVLLGSGLVFDSEPLRTRVLPELNRALAEFRAVEVPKGAQDVAVKVDGALTYVINQVSRMADRADAGSSYEFSYDTQFNAARQAVQDYATEIDGDVAEALDRIRGAKPT